MLQRSLSVELTTALPRLRASFIEQCTTRIASVAAHIRETQVTSISFLSFNVLSFYLQFSSIRLWRRAEFADAHQRHRSTRTRSDFVRSICFVFSTTCCIFLFQHRYCCAHWPCCIDSSPSSTATQPTTITIATRTTTQTRNNERERQ